MITRHISQSNEQVLNMLNTKYIIMPRRGEEPVAQLNTGALGNVWFVDRFMLVDNPDDEISALSNFNPANEAIIDERFEGLVKNLDMVTDSTANISLASYLPNHLVYNSSAKFDRLAVFSEIYYEKGWNAYIDGNKVPYFRVNYVLRAMIVPQGEHTIEFKFHPKTYFTGQKISLASSIILLLILGGLSFVEVKKLFIENRTPSEKE